MYKIPDDGEDTGGGTGGIPRTPPASLKRRASRFVHDNWAFLAAAALVTVVVLYTLFT